MSKFLLWTVSAAALARAATLEDVCTTAHAKAAVPVSGLVQGVVTNPSSITAAPVYNESTAGSDYYPAGTYDYCNITMTYSHAGKDDSVLLQFWMPTPDDFQNRWVSTGGFGFAINVASNVPAGLPYGAVAGRTDGGFGSFDTQFSSVYPLVNGTANYDALYMFGYQAHHEMSSIGKAFTKNFYSMSDKLYAYYQGCSEGGREGWSQVQRFPEEWDGAVIGAPAIRYGQQQVNHLVPQVVEQTLDYYPENCEFSEMVTLIIDACDELDGRKDGVISRTDLCQLNFDLKSTIGKPYACNASTSMGVTTPAQNGTITAEGVRVAQTILDGLKDSEGRQAYFWYRIGSEFTDAETSYDSTTGTYGIDISELGGEWVTHGLQLLDLDNLSNLDNVTYDTLRDWMLEGLQRYEDVLQTTWPDLSRFQAAGGKVIHYHGESDNSIPPASSVRYFESVRDTMFPNKTYNASVEALNEFYRLYLVPGASHCNTNSLQPNGPYPQNSLGDLMNWVEKGIEPVTLNGTVLSGDYEGEEQKICSWPLRPLWKNNGTVMDCVYDQKSIDTWLYDLDATHSATLTIGGGLGVAPNGLRVLERLDEDILRDAVSGGYMVDHSNLKDKHGRVLMRLPSSSTTTTGSRDSDGTTTTPMHLLGTSRHNIWRCLRKRIPDSIIINKRVASVTAHPTHRNTVTFVDGSEPVHADLVIGADGLKSVTKHALFDGDPYPPHYEGLIGIGGFLPTSTLPPTIPRPEPGSMNFCFSGTGFFGYFYATSSPTSVQTMWPTWTSPPLPTWEREGVVLVGDAAHALPSTSGQGASQALEDVEALGRGVWWGGGRETGYSDGV
ncbi:Integral peroxisomal membrane peroxin family protein [Aspergillus niger]|uniref:Carboxylic ester hydrolase n=1 Tax=Aspergillus niger TaxID=5061 RepID=A0A505HQQ7_ASPNG|nr:Integral peroxisomal membrane peroxin family protein [Aspergillus niger]